MFLIHHHHWAAVMSCGLAKTSACRFQVCLSCAVLCQIVSLRYLSGSSLHCLAGLPCRLFLQYGLQVVTCEVHQSSLRWLICHTQDNLIFLTLLIPTWPAVTPPTLLELCRAWPAVTPPTFVMPWVQSPIRPHHPAASVHCMHIHIFNKVAVA